PVLLEEGATCACELVQGCKAHRVGGAGNHDETAARKQSGGLLGPPLRDDRISCTTHHECRRLQPRQLTLDAIAEGVAKCGENAPDAGVSVVLPNDRSERGPRPSRLE